MRGILHFHGHCRAMTWFFFLGTSPWAQCSQKPSLSTLLYQVVEHSFLNDLIPMAGHGETQETVIQHFAFSRFQWWHHRTSFVGSTSSIDIVLSYTFAFNITGLVNRFWHCQIFYWLTFIHLQFDHFTALYRERPLFLSVLALPVSISACPLANFGVDYPWVLLRVLQSLPVGNEPRQWTHAMANVDAFSIVIIVYFIAWNLNFNILAKFEI